VSKAGWNWSSAGSSATDAADRINNLAPGHKEHADDVTKMIRKEVEAVFGELVIKEKRPGGSLHLRN